MKRLKKIIALACTGLMMTTMLTGCGTKSSSEVLNIYNVGDYIDESLIKKFEEETGIKVVYETNDTNERKNQKIKNGGSK